jgi:hypothetical protein
MRKFISFLILIFLISSCDVNNQKLLIFNNTGARIYCQLLTDTILEPGQQVYQIEAGDSAFPNFVMGGNGAWEYKINHNSVDSTLHVFIFNIESVPNNNILTKEIISNANFKRIDLKVQDLEKLDWKLKINK